MTMRRKMRLRVTATTVVDENAEMMQLVEYKSGRMSDADATKFEDQLAKDSGFRDRMMFWTDVWSLMEQAPITVVTRKEINEDIARNRAQTERQRRRYGRHIAAAITWIRVMDPMNVVFGLIVVGATALIVMLALRR
jgi:hypothetical protein